MWKLTNGCHTSRCLHEMEIRFFPPNFSGGEKKYLYSHRTHRTMVYISYFTKLMLLDTCYVMFCKLQQLFSLGNWDIQQVH